MKKIFSVCSTLLLLFSTIIFTPFVSKALTSGTCGYEISWSYYNGVLTLEGSGNMYDYSPNFQPWVEHSADITTIDIGDGINYIGSYAFYGLSNLEKCSVTSSVMSIGDGAFEGSKENLVIDAPFNSYAYIYADYENIKHTEASTSVLETLTENTNNTGNYVGGETDEETNTAKEVETDKEGNIVVIPYAGAADPTDMPSVNLPTDENGSIESEENTDIEESTQNVILENQENETSENNTYATNSDGNRIVWSVKNNTLFINGNGLIPDYNVPSDCPWNSKRGVISKVVIGENITGIGRYNFSKFDNLTSVELPASLNTINDHAFYDCEKLKSIIVPSSVMYLGDKSIGYYFDRDTKKETVRNSFILYGEVGSKAEKYANDNKIIFVKRIQRQKLVDNKNNGVINQTSNFRSKVIYITCVSVIIAIIISIIYYNLQKKGNIEKIAGNSQKSNNKGEKENDPD